MFKKTFIYFLAVAGICGDLSLEANLSEVAKARVLGASLFMGLPLIVGYKSMLFRYQRAQAPREPQHYPLIGGITHFLGNGLISTEDGRLVRKERSADGLLPLAEVFSGNLTSDLSLGKQLLHTWLCGYVSIFSATFFHEFGRAFTNLVTRGDPMRVFIGAPFSWNVLCKPLWEGGAYLEAGRWVFALRGLVPYSGCSHFISHRNYKDPYLLLSLLAGPLSGAALGPWLGPKIYKRLYQWWYGLSNADCPFEVRRSKLITALACHDLYPRTGNHFTTDGAHLLNIVAVKQGKEKIPYPLH